MKRTVWMASTPKSAQQSGVNVRARTAAKCTSDADAVSRGDTLSHSKSGVAPIAVTGVPLGRRRRISPSWWGILRTCSGAHHTNEHSTQAIPLSRDRRSRARAGAARSRPARSRSSRGAPSASSSVRTAASRCLCVDPTASFIARNTQKESQCRTVNASA